MENIIERGVALAEGTTVEMQHLPDDLRGSIIQTFRKKGGKYSTLEDLEKILGLHANEINKYLGVLKEAGKIESSRQERGIFFQLKST